jgi:gluconokinase
MDYFLGIDIGTTAVKSVAFSADGKVWFEQSIAYAMSHPQPDRSEQDPDEIVNSLFQSVENILQHFQLPPVLLSFSSAMHSLIVIDEKGVPLSKCIIWADNRAADIASRLHQEEKAAAYYQKTGVPVHAMSPFCKLLWLRENDPLLFRRAFKFIGIKEYVFFKLFGVYAVDSSIAAATGLMNLHSLQWDASILKDTGLHPSRLSDIVSVRRVFENPLLFPMLKNIPFVIGGSDGAMANLGTHSESKDALVVSIGTSSAARIMVNEPFTDRDMRSFCYHVKDNQYLLGGASNNGAVVLQWLKEKFFGSAEILPDFLAAASGIKPGCDGLILLPYILGERAPLWNASAKAVLFGLTINHARAHIIRAAMESVIHAVYAISESFSGIREMERICVTGGFAQNDLWVQMLADVFNLPVEVSETVENAAWGAVILAMETMGIPSPGAEKNVKRFSPSEVNHRVYHQQFGKYQRLYTLLKAEF